MDCQTSTVVLELTFSHSVDWELRKVDKTLPRIGIPTKFVGKLITIYNLWHGWILNGDLDAQVF